MYTITMNIFAHITTTVHEENSSAMHWIQTNGVKFLLISLVAVALYFGIKRFIDSTHKK